MKKEPEKIRLIRLMGTSIFPEPDDAEKSCTLKSDLLPVWCDHQGGTFLRRFISLRLKKNLKAIGFEVK